MSEILATKISDFDNLSLRKKILFSLYQAQRELSYDELANLLSIKTRKRLTDAVTALRKNSAITQDGGIKITDLGNKIIENAIQNYSN